MSLPTHPLHSLLISRLCAVISEVIVRSTYECVSPVDAACLTVNTSWIDFNKTSVNARKDFTAKDSNNQSVLFVTIAQVGTCYTLCDKTFHRIYEVKLTLKKNLKRTEIVWRWYMHWVSYSALESEFSAGKPFYVWHSAFITSLYTVTIISSTNFEYVAPADRASLTEFQFRSRYNQHAD